MTAVDIEKLKQLIARTDISGNDKVMWLEDFIDGREQQLIQDEFYSEEEVFHLLVKAMKDNKVNQLSFFDNGISNPIYTNLKKWFEQFKKK